MKTIIAGSRSFYKYDQLAVALERVTQRFNITEVVSGTARGVDSFGEQWAKENHIPVTRFPADWNTYGKRAGFLRNVEMSKHADLLVAIWDEESNGTRHMISIMKKADKPIFVFPFEASTSLIKEVYTYQC